jgi:hypothetical protein
MVAFLISCTQPVRYSASVIIGNMTEYSAKVSVYKTTKTVAPYDTETFEVNWMGDSYDTDTVVKTVDIIVNDGEDKETIDLYHHDVETYYIN